MIFAALRFSDALEVADIWRMTSVLCGRSVGQKLNGGELISWAATRRGVGPNGAWVNPITNYWATVDPQGGSCRFLFPYPPNWGSEFPADGSSGAIQHALTRSEFKIGFPKLRALHSPRALYATCDGRLLFSLDQRERS